MESASGAGTLTDDCCPPAPQLKASPADALPPASGPKLKTLAMLVSPSLYDDDDAYDAPCWVRLRLPAHFGGKGRENQRFKPASRAPFWKGESRGHGQAGRRQKGRLGAALGMGACCSRGEGGSPSGLACVASAAHDPAAAARAARTHSVARGTAISAYRSCARARCDAPGRRWRRRLEARLGAQGW